MSNDDTLYGLIPGSYTVTFKSLNRWEKPEDKQVNIYGGNTAQIRGLYMKKEIKTMPMPWLQLLLD
jgi:hypothetical protein